MSPFDLLNLHGLMAVTRGRGEVKVGLIDGPVALDHPDLAGARLEELVRVGNGRCARTESAACQHGTFVAGILTGRHDSPAPSLCRDCSVLVRPIFSERDEGAEMIPRATAENLAEAIEDCLHAGARVLNLSVALVPAGLPDVPRLKAALDLALRQGAVVVTAAGNQGTLGPSPITGHPWVVPVAASDQSGRPLASSNLGGGISRRGLLAPGEAVTSLGTGGTTVALTGTSVAAPFVTATAALLWSAFPNATAAEVLTGLGCVPNSQLCGGSLCASNEVCLHDRCCPRNSVCGDRCCGPGEKCSADGCCPAGRTVCLNRCCGPGESCTPEGCCPPGLCCSSVPCPEGKFCCGGLTCCPQGAQCQTVGGSSEYACFY